MKISFLFDSLSAIAIVLLSFVFQTFNVGYYSFGSFLGISIGSLIVGGVRNRFMIGTAIGSSLVGLTVMIITSLVIIQVFPMKMRDFGDIVMPYINLGLNGIIYVLNGIGLLKMKQRAD
jgi:hypothetical protein